MGWMSRVRPPPSSRPPGTPPDHLRRIPTRHLHNAPANGVTRSTKATCIYPASRGAYRNSYARASRLLRATISATRGGVGNRRAVSERERAVIRLDSVRSQSFIAITSAFDARVGSDCDAVMA